VTKEQALMPEVTDHQVEQHPPGLPEPSYASSDGTPQNDPAAALHWAAVALGLAETRAEQGHPLTGDERDNYNRYQQAAHAHGFTDQQIRCYADTELRPTEAM
jgi:hypothetical protein